MIFSKAKPKPLIVEYQELAIAVPTVLKAHWLDKEDKNLRARVIGQLEALAQLYENVKFKQGDDIRSKEHKQATAEFIQSIVKDAELNYTRSHKNSPNYISIIDLEKSYRNVFHKVRELIGGSQEYNNNFEPNNHPMDHETPIRHENPHKNNKIS